MMSQWCYNGFTAVSQRCYSDVTYAAFSSSDTTTDFTTRLGAACACNDTLVLHWCYSGVTVVLQWCYSGVTVVLQWCYSGVTVV
jgi:hypothetical protein